MHELFDIKPLTGEETEQLRFIYRKRLRFFLPVYLFLAAYALFLCFRIDYTPRFSDKVHRWSQQKEGEGLLSRAGMVAVNMLFIEGPILIVGLIIYRKRIDTFRRDIKNGVKECLYYRVVSKQHFPLTRQYFISFDDPTYMHHEVDELTFYLFREGDTAVVTRAPRSKYVFNERGAFSIL